MPRLSPDRLPAELQPLLDEIRPPRRIKFMSAKAPANIHDSLMQAALVCPRYTDIAAFYWVDELTFAQWRKDDPQIDITINQARQADTQEVLQAVRKRAIEGSAPHAKLYLERMRPDLNTENAPTINNTVKVTVLPTPATTGKIQPPKSVIEGSATEIGHSSLPSREPHIPEPRKPKTPLFGGKDVTTPNAPASRGK